MKSLISTDNGRQRAIAEGSDPRPSCEPTADGAIAREGTGPPERRDAPWSLGEGDDLSDAIEVTGEVIQPLPNAQFKVLLPNGHELLAYLGGKLRKNRIRVLLGDTVKVELSPYDLTRGRITYRVR